MQTKSGKIVSGKGIIESDSSGKFMIDLKKLEQNILSVIYKKSGNNKIKPILISDNVKKVIMNIIENKMNMDNYNKLDDEEKRIVENFTQCMNLDIKVTSNKTKDLLKSFEVLKLK